MGKKLDNSYLLQGVLRYSKKGAQIVASLNRTIQNKCSACRTRTKKLGKNPNFLTDDVRHKVADALGMPCPYCGEMITHKNYSVDHELALSRGGESVIDNLEIICLSCNKKKDKMLKDEFAGLMEYIKTLTPESQKYVNRQLSMSSGFKPYLKKGA